MRTFKVLVCPDPSEPDTATGYVRAADLRQARAMLPAIPHLVVIPLHPEMLWPGFPDRLTDWSRPTHGPMPELVEAHARAVLAADPDAPEEWRSTASPPPAMPCA